MPETKLGGGIISAKYTAVEVPAVVVEAPTVDDPGFFLQLDNQVQEKEGGVALRLNVCRHADKLSTSFSILVKDAPQEVQDAVMALVEVALKVANPAMGFEEIKEP